VSIGVKTDHGVISLLIIEVWENAVYVDLAACIAAYFLVELVSLNTNNYLDSSLLPEHPGDEASIVHHAEWYLLIENDNNGVFDSLPLVVFKDNVLVVDLVVKFFESLNGESA